MPEKKIDVHYCFFRSWMAKVIDDDFPELNIFWHDYKWSPPNRKLFSFFENFYTRGEYWPQGPDRDFECKYYGYLIYKEADFILQGSRHFLVLVYNEINFCLQGSRNCLQIHLLVVFYLIDLSRHCVILFTYMEADYCLSGSRLLITRK